MIKTPRQLQASLSLRIFVSLIGVAAISALLAGGMSFYLSLKVLREDVQIAISNSAQKLIAAAANFDRQMEIENWQRLDRDFMPTLVGEIIRVADENNHEIFVSFRTDQIAGLDQQMVAAQMNTLHFGSSGDSEYAIWTTSYHLRSGPKRVLQVALPLPSSQSLARKSIIYFIPVFFIILLVVGIISIALRRRILKPVAGVAEHLAAFRHQPIRNWSLIPQQEQSEFFGEIVDHVNELINRTQESSVFRENWARSIAHEIRTPLMLMLGEIETADVEQLSKDDLKALLEQMKMDVVSIESIVKAVLEIGNRVKTDRASLEPVDLGKQIRILVDSFMNNFGMNIDLSLNNFHPLDSFQFDWSLLRIILDNLLRNSLKHGGKRNPVSIEATFESNRINLKVSDKSSGFSETVLTALENWRHWDARVGVGLNLCKQIASLTGWKISFSNLEKMGTSVELCIPVSKLN